MSFTYGTLKTAIQQYADNAETSFVANLPLFIRAVEERILKSVDLTDFRKNVTGTLQANSQFLAVPSDYLASFSLSAAYDGTQAVAGIIAKNVEAQNTTICNINV